MEELGREAVSKNLVNLERYRNYFLIGIGGAGMSAIAIVLAGMGFNVCGSDIKESHYIDILRSEGISVFIGHRKDNIKGADVVIYSSAIPETNVEIVAAREMGIPVYARSDILASILNSRKGIAVTGTHGKTTTTSMISLMLRGLGLDPTIIIGGELNELGSNARYGEGEYVVAEACESDGSFLKYSPYISVVTNIEDDHLDFYHSYENLRRSFLEFLGNTKHGGIIVLNGDEVEFDKKSEIGFKNLSNVRMIYYGLSNRNNVWAENIEFSSYGSTYDLCIKEKEAISRIKVKLNVPGIHNIKNSLAALSVCYGIGLNVEEAARILRFFTGVRRRFEKRGEKKGALFFDDYAHHPSEVRATLEAASRMDKRRLIAIFQPHRYTRLKSLYRKFGACFDFCDILIVTDVYGAGEEPLPGVNGKLLIDSLIDCGFNRRLVYIPSLKDVSHYLEDNIREGDLVLVMGAGDVTRVTEEFLRS
ncbi:MAG: UDP-N-acetylmuramate--L-alanine ligase [Actinobacteria bacterium]|nr:UDP-N-acetylmuramate--L-alanine ligase [Actinomycetota bacterium]